MNCKSLIYSGILVLVEKNIVLIQTHFLYFLQQWWIQDIWIIILMGAPKLVEKDILVNLIQNGYNVDMRYLWKDKRKQKINITNEAHWKEFDLYRHSVFMSKLSKRGYNDFLVEPCDSNKEKYFSENKLEGDNYTYKFNISPHKDHVHIQGIFYTKISISNYYYFFFM